MELGAASGVMPPLGSGRGEDARDMASREIQGVGMGRGGGEQEEEEYVKKK